MNDTLRALYPFLHGGGAADPARLDAALLDAVRRKAEDGAAVQQRFFAAQGAALVAMARALAAVYARGRKLLVMGNGGSSCDAAHVAVEFLHPVTAGRPALAAVNLAADVAMLTAVGNDVGIEQVFVRQVLAHGVAGDALLGLSTSGQSANLLAAFDKARALGLVTLGLAGHDGGAMAAPGRLDHCLVVPSDSVHRIQETHVACYHVLWDLVHTLLAETRGGLPVAEAGRP